jgi:hypothetical protein
VRASARWWDGARSAEGGEKGEGAAGPQAVLRSGVRARHDVGQTAAAQQVQTGCAASAGGARPREAARTFLSLASTWRGAEVMMDEPLGMSSTVPLICGVL